MAGLGSSEWMPPSETQQGSDGQIGAGAPAQTLTSIEPPLFQGLPFSGDLSHLLHIDQSFGCHGEPMQQSFFPRDEGGVGPIERIPHDVDREVTAATAQPCTRVHQPRDAAQSSADKTRKGRRCSRIKSVPVTHNEQNSRQIRQLEPHLQSLILFHISNTEELQVFALKRILEYLQQCPPIHICRVERKNGDPRGMILLVICLLCPPGPQAPSPFKEPNALPKFAHHFRIVHCDIKNPFTCVVPLCDKSFSLRHDMARHVKATHPDTTGDIEDDIPDPVAASNVAGPSNTRHAFNGSSPVVAQHNTSSFPSSIPGPSRRVKPYPSQPMAPLSQDRGTMRHVMQPNSFRIQPASGGVPISTQSGGAAGPSNSHRAGYMMSANPPSVGYPSSNSSPMSFHDARGVPYRGLPQIPASGTNETGDYLRSHGQMTQTLSPFLLNGNPSGVPSETHPRIRSRQAESSTVIAQMALPMTFNYPTNTTAENRFAQPRQFRMPSSSVYGPRQPIPTQDTAMALTQQQLYGSNRTRTSTRHAQALDLGVDYMTMGSAGQENPFGELGYMHPGNQNLSTSSQMSHVGSIQRPQPQPPLQGRVGATLNHDQHALYHPREPPQAFLNMGSWMFTRPPLDPRNLRTSSQTNRARTKPPQHSGDNVSPERTPLKGEVERNLPLWLGLIRLVVGVSEAFLNAILVFLDPPWERTGCTPFSESGG